jgi:hypothetical protein
MVALATGPHVETPAPIRTERIRRFSEADLSMHGQWILRRLQQVHPTNSERSLVGWLRNLNFDNASLFLATDNGVALFQVTSWFTLAAKPVVIERFVFAMEGYTAEAAEFYTEAVKWTKIQSIETLIVKELSDVPKNLIKEKVGDLYTRQQFFAKP